MESDVTCGETQMSIAAVRGSRLPWLLCHYVHVNTRADPCRANHRFLLQKKEHFGSNCPIPSASPPKSELQCHWLDSWCCSFRFATWPSPFSLPPPPRCSLYTLITDGLVCSWARRAALASLQTRKPPNFCTFLFQTRSPTFTLVSQKQHKKKRFIKHV